MSIILNEREWVESALKNKALGRKPMEGLSRVARYMSQVCGYDRQHVRSLVESFLLQCDPGASLNKWTDKLDAIVKDSGKRLVVDVPYICITNEELSAIELLHGKLIKRLAFVLLCVAKYNSLYGSSGWVNTADNEIMTMANVSTSTERQSQMFHELRDLGFIKFSKRIDSLSVQVLYMRPDGETALHIDDFRNLGNQYRMYCGEDYFRCSHCGLTVKKTSNASKYCPGCAAELYIRKSVESVMRRRESGKDSC